MAPLSIRIYVLILLVTLCVESKTKSTESEESTEKLQDQEMKPQKVFFFNFL